MGSPCLGGIGALRSLPAGVDAVVSLCRVGDPDVRVGGEHVEVRMVDRDGVDENPHLGFVLADTAELILRLRREGRTVLLHCVQAQSRTPAIAALYGMRYGVFPLTKRGLP
jgi:ADP-ribosyl-[dinitrogen reductase] hydrolase